MKPKPKRYLGRGVCPRCGKQRFATRKIATTALRAVEQNEHMSAYTCAGWWHIGRMTKGEPTGNKRRRKR